MRSSSLWYPLRGTVTITPDEGGRHRVACSACGWQYVASVKADASDQKRWHHCPAGTAGAVPACPVCDSVTARCAGVADGWHEQRMQVAAAAATLNGPITQT